MKEASKETDNIIKDSIEASNNEIPTNNNILQNFNCVNEYTPFKFDFEHRVKEKNNNLKKYFAFTYFDNSSMNKSDEKIDKNNNRENEDIINENEKNQNNEKNIKVPNNKIDINMINNSYNSHNSNNNVNYQFMNNLIDIVKEDDENEYSESEEHRVVDYHSYSEDDFGVGVAFTVRPDSCVKNVVINIIDTYNSLDPNYKYVKLEEEKEEEKNIILTVPSEPVKNNGKDNENNDLIVSKGDEIKNKKNTSYIIKDLLGTGVSGQAFKVFCPNNNNYYALKIIKNNDFFLKRSLFEIRIMSILNEKDKNDQYHIIRLIDSFLFNNHLCIVLELLHTTLLQILEMNNSEGISLNSIRFILKQILESVEFMNSLKVVHTDLKPENILLSVYKKDNNENRSSNLNLSNNLNNKKNNPNQINTNNNNNTSGINNMSNISFINRRVSIKIADFGEAVPFLRLGQRVYIQSMFYRAPEVILLNKRNEKIDIWSIGCILGELYLGTPIMPGSSSYDQLYKINVLIGECPQYMIEDSPKKNKYFIKDKLTYNYRIKTPEEFFKEYPNEPKSKYEIPKNMKNIDDLINIKKDTIKSKNSLHKSMHNSSLSLNSSNTKEDLVAFIHLMKGMLQIDPNKRWNCKQCLKHPFLTKEKLDKFIPFELNEINQLMSNSFNSNNSYNFQKNNCHSMIMNNSFNKFQMNKGGNINKNNTFYGGNFISKNKNNYSFGNYNNNNNININNNNNNYNYIQSPIIPPPYQQNYNMNNNNIYQLNYNNNIYHQGNNNINNKKLNSSFSFKKNYNNMIPYNNLYQFNFIPNRIIPQNFIPYQNNPYFNIPNNFIYNNQSMNNRINPNFNNQYMKHNNTFMGTSFERLNTSYNSNSNISKNSKSNKQNIFNNQKQFHKNKKNINNKEFLFNKENIILGNVEDNKQETRNKEKDTINDQALNEDKNNSTQHSNNNNLNNNDNINKNENN